MDHGEAARADLMQRMIAQSRELAAVRARAAALRRAALDRVGINGDGDAVTMLVVPAQRAPLVEVSATRKRALRRHLCKVLRAAAANDPRDVPAAAAVTEPTTVARRACAMCQGRCCGNGDNRAYLTEDTMARVAAAAESPSAVCIMRRYMACVPRESVENSCIFHSARGCTLERSLRADICNRHYCGPMRKFLRTGATFRDVLVIAAKDSVLHDAAVVPRDALP